MNTPLSPKQAAILTAREVLVQRPLFLDTETTGLDNTAEIVEIGIVDHDGAILFESLVRPAHPIPAEAIAVHHITNQMVQVAKPWPVLWPAIRGLILNRVIAVYNAEYDLRVIQNSLTQYGLSWKDNLKTFCVMKLYAQFKGVWDPYRRSYRFFSLDYAGQACGLALPNAHRAVADSLLTKALLEFIADSNP